MTTTKNVSILVELSDGAWVAHCIDHDMSTQANSKIELEREIAFMFACHEHACKEIGLKPYYMDLAPVDVRARYDAAPLQSYAWVFTAGGSHLRLTIREAAT